MDKTNRGGLRAALLVFTVFVSFYLMGSALTQPPIDARFFRFTAAGTPLTTADTDINLLQFAGKSATCAITVINDNAAGGNEVLFCVANGVTTAAAGSDGATGSSSIAVKPGETFNLDGRFTHVTLRSSAGTSAARVIPSYDR